MRDTSSSNEALFRRLTKLFRLDREFSAAWRKGAKEDFDFVAGDQWSAEDKEHLKSLMRPVVQMNLTLRNVNAVSGQEMANRQEVRYIPREPGDVKPNELLTEGARWFRDVASGDDEDSEAFVHMVECGMGWTDTTLNYEADEDGEPDMEAVNPIEMYWDRSARRNNLVDAERIWRVRKLTLAKAKKLFPEADVVDLDGKWSRIDGDEGEPKDQDRARLYEDDDDSEASDDDQVTIVHCQYVVDQPAWDVITPLSGDKQEMSDADYKKFAKRAAELGLPLRAARKTKRVIKDCWLGAVVLQTNDALCQDKFRYQCITGYRDESKGWFYGVVRAMKDPQRWANKWLSQTLDIMNSNAKGGLLAERGVTDNPRQFEKDWARPDKITWVDDGSLSGPNGPRVIPKQAGQFPQGFYQLMTFAFEMVQTVPGISPELLGQVDRDQAASLEYQRRQAGMTILQPLFKNLKRYRREQGHVILYILQNYLSDGRLVRVLGDEQQQYVPLIRQADMKYDIIVDEMPTSPNQKELTWALIKEVLPIIGDKVSVETLLTFLESSPLPSKTVEQMKKKAETDAQGPMMQLQQQMAQLSAALEQAKIGLTQAQAAKAGADAQKTLAEIGQGPNGDAETAKVQGELRLKEVAIAADAEHQRAKMVADLQHHQMKHASEMHLQSAKIQGEQMIAREKAHLDAGTKLTSAMIAARTAEKVALAKRS